MQQEDFPSATFAFELNLDLLTGRAPVLKFQPFSSYPALDRDMAFFCAKTIPLVDLLALIRQSAGDLLVSVDLFDEYTGQNVPPGLRSLAFRLVYRAADHTLTDAEVTTCQQRVREALVTQFQVQLRS
jgi:phenylalanyl-tRNA synthetase beta chain